MVGPHSFIVSGSSQNLDLIFISNVQEIKTPSAAEKQHLEEILHRPITRMQRNSLVLQDLLQATSTSHPDYPILKEALTESQQFLREKVRVQSTGAGVGT